MVIASSISSNSPNQTFYFMSKGSLYFLRSIFFYLNSSSSLNISLFSFDLKGGTHLSVNNGLPRDPPGIESGGRPPQSRGFSRWSVGVCIFSFHPLNLRWMVCWSCSTSYNYSPHFLYKSYSISYSIAPLVFRSCDCIKL